MTALYGKALFCRPPRVCKKVCDSYLRIMMSPFTAWRVKKKKKQNQGYYPVFITSLLP